MFNYEYAIINKGDSYWGNLDVDASLTYKWDDSSTYIQNPPYFDNFDVNPQPINDITGARVLLLLGDTVTTDHILQLVELPLIILLAHIYLVRVLKLKILILMAQGEEITIL